MSSEIQIDYEIRKSRRKNICLKIDKKGRIIIMAPLFMTEKACIDFMTSHKKWIITHVKKIKDQNTSAQAQGLLTEEEIKELKKKARKIITERVEFYAKREGISYKSISIRLQKTRWGSCSRQGTLNFNCLLALMPLEILDSVVVHELCHRFYLNHSKNFYAEVYRIFPDYKKCDKWLKENGGTYLARVP